MNESLYIELIHATARLHSIILQLEQLPGVRLNYDQSFAVAKATELRQMAMADAKRAGLTIEAPK